MLATPGSQLVFQQTIETDDNYFSDPRFNDWLAKRNDLSLILLADRATTTGTVTLFVQDTVDEQIPWQAAVVLASGPFAGTLVGRDTKAAWSRPALALKRVGIGVDLDAVGSVRVSVWAASRGKERALHRLLLKKRMEGTAVAYAEGQSCTGVASADETVLTTFAEEVSGSSPTLTVQMEESPNGATWSDVSGASWSGAIGDSVPHAVSLATDSNTVSGFIRFRAQLGGTAPAASVRIWVTGRDVHGK